MTFIQFFLLKNNFCLVYIPWWFQAWIFKVIPLEQYLSRKSDRVYKCQDSQILFILYMNFISYKNLLSSNYNIHIFHI